MPELTIEQQIKSLTRQLAEQKVFVARLTKENAQLKFNEADRAETENTNLIIEMDKASQIEEAKIHEVPKVETASA